MQRDNKQGLETACGKRPKCNWTGHLSSSSIAAHFLAKLWPKSPRHTIYMAVFDKAYLEFQFKIEFVQANPLTTAEYQVKHYFILWDFPTTELKKTKEDIPLVPVLRGPEVPHLNSCFKSLWLQDHYSHMQVLWSLPVRLDGWDWNAVLLSTFP